MYDVFLYIVANDGIDSHGAYSYRGQVTLQIFCDNNYSYWGNYLLSIQQQSSCSYSENGRGATMSGSVSISCGSESDLQSAVANVGPIAVAVDATSNAFRVSEEEGIPCTV